MRLPGALSKCAHCLFLVVQGSGQGAVLVYVSVEGLASAGRHPSPRCKNGGNNKKEIPTVESPPLGTLSDVVSWKDSSSIVALRKATSCSTSCCISAVPSIQSIQASVLVRKPGRLHLQALILPETGGSCVIRTTRPGIGSRTHV